MPQAFDPRTFDNTDRDHTYVMVLISTKLPEDLEDGLIACSPMDLRGEGPESIADRLYRTAVILADSLSSSVASMPVREWHNENPPTL